MVRDHKEKDKLTLRLSRRQYAKANKAGGFGGSGKIPPRVWQSRPRSAWARLNAARHDCHPGIRDACAQVRIGVLLILGLASRLLPMGHEGVHGAIETYLG